MECPKCGGGCLLSEEELIKVLEERSKDQLRAIVRGIYICRACTQKFSRLFVDDLSRRKRPEETRPTVYTPSTATETSAEKVADEFPEEGLKFF